MKKTTALLLSLALTLSSARAAELFKLDRRIGTRRLRVMAESEDPARVRVPRSFFSKNHLIYLTVTATSDPSMDMGIISDVSYVSHAIEGGEVKFLTATRTVGNPDSTIGQEVASFPVEEEAADVVRVDLRTDMSFRTSAGLFRAEAPKLTQDVDLRPDRLAYTQVFEMTNVQPASAEAVSQMTIGVRMYILERENPSYQPKAYPNSDRKKVGFFALSTFQGVFDDFPADDRIMRWDIRRPITYVLHPSVPSRYRDRLKKAILSWNPVFKATTGREPVKVVESDDVDLLPGDPDQSVVYWFSGDVPKMYLGQARPLTDPRTGEVFTSYMLLAESEFESAIENDRVFEMIRDAANPRPSTTTRIAFGEGLEIVIPPRSEDITRISLIERLLGLFDSQPEENLARLIDNTVAHETGHSLGLRHNFKSSSDLSRLEDGEFATTVMDYVSTHVAPRTPQGYDYKAIAYGYDGRVPAEFDKPYLYGSDEHAPTEPDTNPHDLGEPFSHYVGQYKTFRRARVRLPQLAGNPGLYGALMGLATRNLPKFLGAPLHPRHEDARAFFTATLEARGPDATAGGNDGAPSLDVDPELAQQKSLHERTALFEALAGAEAVTYPAAVKADLIDQLTSTFLDEDKTDLFPVRVATIAGFVAFGQEGLVALLGATRKIAAYIEAHPETATREQEVAILQVIRQLLQQAGLASGKSRMTPTEIRDLLRVRLGAPLASE